MDWHRESQRRFPAEQELFGDEKAVNHTMPLVSVCVTTFQHAAFIRECLDGVLMQTTTFPFEVIVGEDESTDGTRETCIDYATRHPDRIRLFLRSRTRSVDAEGGTTRYFNGEWCRQSARGKYIALCDGDDLWTDPTKLQRQVDLLESRPDMSLCGHSVTMGADRGGRVAIWPKTPRPLLNTLEDVLLYNWLPTSSLVFRRDVIPPELPEWARSLPYADWPLQVTAAQRGRIGFLNTVMGFYRVHPDGLWSRLNPVARIEQNLLFYAAVRDQVPPACWDAVCRPRVAKLRMQLSRRHLASGAFARAAKELSATIAADPFNAVVRPASRFLRRLARNRVRARRAAPPAR